MVRKNKDPGGSRGKDRISELPEPLIHLILRFLPSQCVVSTSVLSKRWRYIWKSVPVIDLRELKFPEIVKLEDTSEEFERFGNLYSLLYQSVEDFVDKKLSLHHETRDIKKFYISADDFYASERLEEWIPALFTRHNLEEFELTSESYTSIGFFCSSWTVSSLVVLELDLLDQICLPDAGNFPNLKICRLRNVELCISGDLTQQFFSNLPVLEELELTNCLWHMWDILLISAPVLKYLFITGPHECTEFDDIPVYKFKINIFAPNLQSLRYFDVAAEDYILHRFESLVDAKIYFDRFGTPLPQEKDPIATKFLQQLCNVKRLEISGRTFKELLFPDDLSSNWPTFHNLVHLELTSSTTVSMELLNFLNISPYLETIVFAEGFGVSSSSIDMVPQCMLLHLKSVRFGRFVGCREELNAVKAFLKNARVLRRMIIQFDSYSLSTDKQNKVMKKLLKFPRGSSSCIIEVS